MKIDNWLLEILACPQCHAPLHADDEAGELICTNPDCGLAYPVRDDIPVLLIDEARRPGEQVVAGQKLFALEAMKMETIVYADRAGLVAEVPVQAGTQVEAGDLLLRYEI